MPKPNAHGKYKKADVIKENYQIIDHDGFMTAKQIHDELGVMLTHEQRLKYCKGFRCKKEWRGCSPVFDLWEIAQLIEQGII